MNRITKIFKKGSAYVGYLTAGDGGMDASLQAMLSLIAGGVNILEVGVPFSDPVADGPTIQAACQRALKKNTKMEDVLKLIKELRKQTEIPIILFSYYNPVLIHLKNNFFEKLKACGADGCLIVDLPPEEADDYLAGCERVGLAPIFLISPTTSIERIKLLNQLGKGMLYYVCRAGTTGIKNDLPPGFAEKMATIKSICSLPVIAGFGISNKEMAKSVLAHADGFVVGSLFVDAMKRQLNPQAITQLALSLQP